MGGLGIGLAMAGRMDGKRPLRAAGVRFGDGPDDGGDGDDNDTSGGGGGGGGGASQHPRHENVVDAVLQRPHLFLRELMVLVDGPYGASVDFHK